MEEECEELRLVTEHDIANLASQLNAKGVDYVIFGSIAMRIHGVIRDTHDIDIYIRNDENSIRGVLSAIKDSDLFPEVTDEEYESLVSDGSFEYGVVKFAGEIGVDVATHMGINSIDSLEYEVRLINGVEVRVVTLRQLIQMKSDSLREKDQDDVLEMHNRMSKSMRDSDIFGR